MTGTDGSTVWHPRRLGGFRIAHAEMCALASVPGDCFDDYTLYTTFEPCLMCASAIMMCNIRRVHYAAADPVFDGLHDWFRTLPFAASRLPERTCLGGPIGAFAHVLHLSWIAFWFPDGERSSRTGTVVPRHLELASKLVDVVRPRVRSPPPVQRHRGDRRALARSRRARSAVVPQPRPDRRTTATSNFGVSRRESHDASAFYDRFHAPEVSDDATVLAPEPVAEPFVCGDARSMTAVADGSVALVVTSPPYFAGKQYEEELEREGVPASYLEYLQLLRDVFDECVRTLEPGGRIAVNVANLGRKPYRSLSADVIRILQDDLGLLLRGELIWQKGEGATGSCAWGSFRSATNPVLRDITERVVIASKGRFDRAGRSSSARSKGCRTRTR